MLTLQPLVPSSLLNLLLEDDRAIVTEIAGTTRDVITGTTFFKGQKFNFVDTAGIRATASDKVEQLGIERSRSAHSEADIVLFVFDAADGLTQDDLTILTELDGSVVYVVGNKTDKLDASEVPTLSQNVNLALPSRLEDKNLFFLSALDENARPILLSRIAAEFADSNLQDQVLLSNTRHFENLSKAVQNVERCQALLQDAMGSEFIAFELKEALIAVQETLGKRFDDQVMDRVFKEFCLGK
ncbi:MAG: GTP-binding protein [Proteobacteria bacterium]|nr:MAG: GTP-binding protein [Pseudomonadota bacterium]